MDNGDILKDLSQIRSLMEKSTKFISISGLSGILAGLYTLLTVAFVGWKLQFTWSSFSEVDTFDELLASTGQNTVFILIAAALVLLTVSVATGVVMANQKSVKQGQSAWNPTSKALLLAVSVPLLVGGAVAFIALLQKNYSFVIPSLLIFYGLALFSGSHFTFKEIRILGLLQIFLGLLALIYSSYGFVYFAAGFGLLHILYGAIIIKKHGA
jgi:uncharacterized membrane protein YidH (DUF202 family)